MKTEIHESFVIVHSTDRDVSKYPSPAKYRIELDKIYENVREVSLHCAILPNLNSIFNEPYLLLTVDEVGGSAFRGTNRFTEEAMALLTVCDDNATDKKFFTLIGDHVGYGSQQRIAKLSSLTIQFTDAKNQLFDFGTDAPGSSINHDAQNTLIFKVKHDVFIFNQT